jgi:hypothetical protein
MRCAALLLLAVGAATASAAEKPLPEFSSTYTVSWNGISLGDATISLKATQPENCYVYESATDPIGIVRLFYGAPNDISEFCVVNGKVVPKKFQFINPKDQGAGFTLEFDMKALSVRDGKGGERDIPANAQDRFSLQQAVRLWLLQRLKEKDPGAESVEFASVDDKKVRVYRFAITGREPIDIPAGHFETMLIQRVDDPKKSVKFWLAPERGYMPVKVEQSGKVDVKMVLKK